MRKQICTRLGFTLVELLVVITIIGMLAAIAVPSYQKVRDKAREAETARNVDTIRKALESFAVDHNGLYPYRVHAYDMSGTRELVNTDEDGFAPMGIWGGVEVVSANGAPLPAYYENKPVGPVWDDNPLLHYTYFNQYTDPLRVLGYLAQYPQNPFLKRPMGAALWAFTGGDVTIPSPSVIVLAGDFVYTYNMGDAIDPTSATSDRADPPGVIINADSYDVNRANSAMPPMKFKLDLVDNYQLWAYGKLPMNGPFYAIYDNNTFAAPTKRINPKKDWNGNGAKDEFEKGIVMYTSGGKKFFEDKTSTGQKNEF